LIIVHFILLVDDLLVYMLFFSIVLFKAWELLAHSRVGAVRLIKAPIGLLVSSSWNFIESIRAAGYIIPELGSTCMRFRLLLDEVD